jgi:uncharacterized membrane protein
MGVKIPGKLPSILNVLLTVLLVLVAGATFDPEAYGLVLMFSINLGWLSRWLLLLLALPPMTGFRAVQELIP